jgi:hypothetical protein
MNIMRETMAITVIMVITLPIMVIRSQTMDGYMEENKFWSINDLNAIYESVRSNMVVQVV